MIRIYVCLSSSPQGQHSTRSAQALDTGITLARHCQQCSLPSAGIASTGAHVLVGHLLSQGTDSNALRLLQALLAKA